VSRRDLVRGCGLAVNMLWNLGRISGPQCDAVATRCGTTSSERSSGMAVHLPAGAYGSPRVAVT
jgi:hypothetical protein